MNTPRTASSSAKVVVALIVAMATLAAGFLLGNVVRDDDEAETSLPALTHPVPILAPVGYGDVEPPVPTEPDGLSTTTTPESTPSSAAPSGVAPIAPTSSGAGPTAGASLVVGVAHPVLDAAAPGPDDVPPTPEAESTSDVDGAVVPSSDLADASTLGVTLIEGPEEHFEDPCATGTADGSEDCPGGVHGTILALRAPAPLELASSPFPRSQGVVPFDRTWCPQEVVGDSVVVGISSNNPIAAGTLTVHGFGDGEADRSFSFSTSDADRGAFDAWFSDASGYDVAHRLQHCLVIDGVTVGDSYGFDLDATDIFGSRAGIRGGPYNVFVARGPRRRPPSTIGSLNGEVFAVGWSKPGDRLDLVSYPIPAGTSVAAVDACQLYRSNGSGGSAPAPSTSGLAEASRVLGDAELNSPTYPYDPAYSRVTRLRLRPLAEGTRYTSCMTRVAGTTSFDRNRSHDSETFEMSTPNRLRPKVTFVSTNTSKDLHIRASLNSATTRDFCGYGDVADVAVGDHAFTPPKVWCDLTDRPNDVQSFRRGMDLTLYLGEGRDVATSTFRLPIMLDGCAGRCPSRPTEWYRVPLPEVRFGTGMCGGSGGCDPSSAMGSAGVMTVRVDFSEGSADSGATFETTEMRDVETIADRADGAPAFDRSAPPALVGNGLDPGLMVPVTTDRPTLASVALHAPDGAAPCRTAGAGPATLSDTTFVTERSFTFDHLCPDSRYEVSLTYRDEAGHEVHLDGLGWNWYLHNPLHTEAPRFTITSTVSFDRRSPSQTGTYISTFDMTVGGVEPTYHDHSYLSGCYAEATPSFTGTNVLTTADGVDVNLRVITWPLSGTITLNDGSPGYRRGGCSSGGGGPDGSRPLNLRSHLTLEQLIAGDVTVRSTPDDPYGVSMHLVISTPSYS